MKTFSREFMYENCGCYSRIKLDLTSFMKSMVEEISLDSIIKSEIPLRDKYWFVCRKVLSKEQNQRIAIALAEIVLPIYEKKYPESKAPREAIEAAKQYLSGHISLEALLIKRRAAAAAAAAAAYAYAAATAAAYAADAADAAADAAAAAYAAAADADAAAAYAADAYAADAYKKKIEALLFNICEEIV